MFKKSVKKIFSKINLLNYKKGNRFIFVFHDISDGDTFYHSEHYSTNIENFKAQIEVLLKSFEIISLKEIVLNEKLDSSKNFAAITFDDGFLSVKGFAHPYLTKRKIPYTLFLNGAAILYNQLWVSNLVINKEEEYSKKLCKLSNIPFEETDTISDIIKKGTFSNDFSENYRLKKSKKVYLDKEDINLLKEEGVTFGSHSFDHFNLNSCSSEVLENQINKNKTLIDEITGDNLFFAIPFGKKEHYNQDVITKLKKEGYPFIFSTNPNKFEVKDLNKKDFIFPRIGITNESKKELLLYINRAILKKINI